MSKLRLVGAVFALTLTAAVAGVGRAQVILSDNFEAGVNGANLNGYAQGGIWGRVGFATATPKYASATNPFSSGTLYADVNNPTLAADDTLMLTANTGDTLGTAVKITNAVTTYSFDFWEPATPVAAGIGTAFGYTGPMLATTAPDLNAANRIWRASLGAGTLRAPEGTVEGTAPVAYPVERVNTVWIVANDTASDVVNYAGGRTVTSKRADVWISANGAAPTFAFALPRQNPGTVNITGVGLRAFSTDVGRLYIDNLLLITGATLDRSAITFKSGDADGDGDVDLNDFAAIRDHFRKSVTMRSEGDLNNDGVVNFVDYRQWKTYYTGAVPAGLGVPEPTGAALMGSLAAIALVARRRLRRAALQFRTLRAAR